MRVLLIGAGNIGSALWSAWNLNGSASSVTAVAPNKSERITELLTGNNAYYPSPELIHDKKFDAIVFAVKPQKMAEVLPLYRDFVSPETTILSIAAGKSTTFIRNGLNAANDVPIIRAMPNTPCLIQSGVIGCYADDSVAAIHHERVEKLFAPTGLLFWVDQEEKMHAVTAVSGSGPGFVDAFMEECEQQGMSHDQAIQQVLNAANGETTGRAAEFLQAYQQAAMTQDFGSGELIDTITRKVFEGTAKLALQESGKSFQQLREAVTSPNGTTAAGLAIWNAMKDNALTERTTGTINAARLRSIELA